MYKKDRNFIGKAVCHVQHTFTSQDKYVLTRNKKTSISLPSSHHRLFKHDVETVSQILVIVEQAAAPTGVLSIAVAARLPLMMARSIERW